MSLYQHGKRSNRRKNSKTLLYASFILGVSLIVVALILRHDLMMGTQEKTTVPIVSEVKEGSDDVVKINEPLFTMELPADWILDKRVQESYANYYEWKSTLKGGEGRRLRLHIDIMPASYKVVRMLPLAVQEDKVLPGNMSRECRGFAELEEYENTPVEAKWEGIRFICDPINANQTVGTGTVEDGIGAKIGNHKFFFYWTDGHIRTDDSILLNAIRSFRVK